MTDADSLAPSTYFESDSAGPSPADGPRLGAYRLLRELGRGGQGRVYLAEDERLRRLVALKVIDLAAGPALDRFRREAEVTSKLDHPGVCAVYEVGEDRGRSYIAMRYVEGETLARKLSTARRVAEETGRTPSMWTPSVEAPGAGGAAAASDAPPPSRADLKRTLRFVEKAARALHAAHEAGVVHRDVKPGNLIVGVDGDPVVLDFGLAGVLDDEAAVLTRTGEVFGTPGYMAPEQIVPGRGKPDPRTDVYALGVVLFECLTLRRPFDRPTRDALFTAILVDDPPDVRKFNRAVPIDLKTVVELALEKEPRRRYESALHFADDLRRARESEPVAARRVGPLGRAVRFSRRRPAVAALAAVLAIATPTTAWLGATYVANRPKVLEQERLDREEAAEFALDDAYRAVSLGLKDEALAGFRRAREIRPEAHEAIAGAALIRLRSADPAGALAELEAAPPETRDAFAPLRASALANLGRLEEARAAAQTPASNTALGWFVRGWSAGADDAGPASRPSGAAYAARDAAYRAVFLSPKPRRLYYDHLAEAALRVATRGDVRDLRFARAVAESAVEQWPDDPSGWFYRGVAAGLEDDVEAAKSHYRRALELGGSRMNKVARAHVELNLANLLADDRRPEGHAEAEAIYRRLVEADGGAFASAHRNYAAFLQRRGRRADAAPHFARLAELRPDEPEPYAQLAVLHLEDGRADLALAALDRELALRPRDPIAAHNRANALGALGRADDALAAARFAAEVSPGDADVRCALAARTAQAGRRD
ncbi:MAG TPA: protein kinase, partial [Planctomycetota bacterium]|nr:protein kinase [Planctomycetota bacterium]